MGRVRLKRILSALGLLFAVVLVVGMIANWRAEREVARMAKSPRVVSAAVVTAVQMWAAEKRGCPTVQVLRDEKFLDPAFVLDQWGAPYVIECASETIEIHSLGQDRKPGTADDVVVSGRK